MKQPWLVTHNGHRAWWQRAFMIGDFAPGRTPASWYVVDDEGRSADPSVPPTCETCGVVPKVEELDVMETATGIKNFLARSRTINRWPRPTDPATCWWCNCPGLELADGLLCSGCAAHLSGQPGERMVVTPKTPKTRDEALAARRAKKQR